MNKYVLLMTMVLFLVLITLMVDSLGLAASQNILAIEVSTEVPGFFNILASVWNYLSLFFVIMFFDVPGLPGIFKLVVFYPLTAGTIFMIVDIIRGNG
ncbi:MAG: hypothetical protein WD512_03105 [Candidatus Paceibacterota bacterium]